MKTGHNIRLPSRTLLRLAVLLLGGLVLAGCTGVGNVPKGWSGGVVADETLFIASMKGKLIAVNTTDGGQRGAPVALETTPPSGGFGCTPAAVAVVIYGSPATAGDLVYVGGYNGKVYAFTFSGDELRSEPRWIYPRQGNIGGAVVGGTVVAQGRVYFGASDGKVYALDANDGFKVWEF